MLQHCYIWLTWWCDIISSNFSTTNCIGVFCTSDDGKTKSKMKCSDLMLTACICYRHAWNIGEIAIVTLWKECDEWNEQKYIEYRYTENPNMTFTQPKYTKIYCERKSRNRMNEWTNSKREWIKQCDRLVDHACKKANISVIVHFGARNPFIWYAHVWHDYVKGKALKFGFHVTSYIRLSIGSRNQLTATIKWFY